MNNWKKYTLAAVIITIAGFAYVKNTHQSTMPTDLRDAVANPGLEDVQKDLGTGKGKVAALDDKGLEKANKAFVTPKAVKVSSKKCFEEHVAQCMKVAKVSLDECMMVAAHTCRDVSNSDKAAKAKGCSCDYTDIPEMPDTPNDYHYILTVNGKEQIVWGFDKPEAAKAACEEKITETPACRSMNKAAKVNREYLKAKGGKRNSDNDDNEDNKVVCTTGLGPAGWYLKVQGKLCSGFWPTSEEAQTHCQELCHNPK